MTGRKYTTAPFWKILIRPVVIFWYPGVLWGFLIYGVTLTWIVVSAHFSVDFPFRVVTGSGFRAMSDGSWNILF